MALENITEEIQRIEAELEELNRTTFEHSMKLREDIKQQTSTPAYQCKLFGKATLELCLKVQQKSDSKEENITKCMTLNIQRISI